MKEEFDSSEMSSAGLFWEHVKQDLSTDMEIHMKTSDLLSPKKSPVDLWGSAAKLWVNLSWHLGPTTYWWTQSHLYLDLQLILSKCWGSLLATVKAARISLIGRFLKPLIRCKFTWVWRYDSLCNDMTTYGSNVCPFDHDWPHDSWIAFEGEAEDRKCYQICGPSRKWLTCHFSD